ncbi:hypothetical protein [Mycolicibacterium llatzerense]|uniref:hypothetical protein n=1 Tax=Mycolicibacterium llatzerense TaxID=280871 RepID=UPI0021B6C3C5|nr:hypothetical protein [Mycolicibacterium llatzerense]
MRLLGPTMSAIAITLLTSACGNSTSTQASSTTATSAATTATTTTQTVNEASPPAGGGLPAYTTPPPDKAGNPPCQLGVGWSTFYSNDGQPNSTRIAIQKQNTMGIRSDFVVLPDNYTIVVQTKDGQHRTREEPVSAAATGPWDSVAEKDFLFPDIDPADVQAVHMTTSKGTCWVDGQP